MKVLVTGAEGTLGKPLVCYLKRRGYDVIATDVVGDCEFLDVTNEKNVISVFKKSRPDAVVHYAARAEPIATSFSEVSEDVIVNVLGTRNVLEGCKLVGAKLIFASSAAVYGDVYLKRRQPLTEESETEPVNPYGVDKLAAEQYIKLYARNFGIEYAVLRFGNVYSWNDRKYLLWKLFCSAFLKHPFKMYGEGELIRDFVYVEDVNRLVELCLESEVTGTFNVGHEALKVRDIVERVRKQFGDFPIVSVPSRSGEQRAVVLDCSKAKRILNWSPRTLLFDVIGLLFEEFRKRVEECGFSSSRFSV
jgi:UDP-glucose 4-epimerase